MDPRILNAQLHYSLDSQHSHMAVATLPLGEQSQYLLQLMHAVHKGEHAPNDLAKIRDIMLSEQHQILGLCLTYDNILVEGGHDRQGPGKEWSEFCERVQEAKKLDALADFMTKEKLSRAPDEVRKAHDFSTIATYWSPEVATYVISSEVRSKGLEVLRQIRRFATDNRDFQRQALPLMNGMLLWRHIKTIKSDDSRMIPLRKKPTLLNTEWSTILKLNKEKSCKHYNMNILRDTVWCDELKLSAWTEDVDGEVQVDGKRLNEWRSGYVHFYLLETNAHGLLCPRHQDCPMTRPSTPQIGAERQGIVDVAMMDRQSDEQGSTPQIPAVRTCRDRKPANDTQADINTRSSDGTVGRPAQVGRDLNKQTPLQGPSSRKRSSPTTDNNPTRRPISLPADKVPLKESELAFAHEFVFFEDWIGDTKDRTPTSEECERIRDELLRIQRKLFECIEGFCGVLDDHCIDINLQPLLNLGDGTINT